MELKPNQIQEQEPSEDLMMDSQVNSEENSSTHMYSMFHNTFSKSFAASRVIILTTILIVIGIFSIPIILYYTLKTSTDPIPQLNSTFNDVDISMVSII